MGQVKLHEKRFWAGRLTNRTKFVPGSVRFDFPTFLVLGTRRAYQSVSFHVRSVNANTFNNIHPEALLKE